MAHPANTVSSTCHCKSVRLTFPRPTDPVNECLCSICRRYGALWAYYKPSEVQMQIEGHETETYIWGPGETIFHRCGGCGCVTHWTAADKDKLVTGVNCRLLEREEFEKLKREVSEGP